MVKKTCLVGGISFISVLGFSEAQIPETTAKTPEKTKVTDTVTSDGFWQANIPGGEFVVPLKNISSVSRHRYILDGALDVDEVTVDTDGQALARFYVITPVPPPKTQLTFAKEAAERSKEIAEQLVARSDVKLQNMVMKKYPETSHAKSIEYRIMEDAQLSSLLHSVKAAWFTGRGRVFAISSTQPTK